MTKSSIGSPKLIKEKESPEKRVLRDLNETIDRYAENLDGSKTQNDDSVFECSFSSGKSQKTQQGNKGTDSLDSSWDSGVELVTWKNGFAEGEQQAAGSGWVRIYTGVEASLIYLTLETTAADVCRDMLLSENLAIFVKVSQVLTRVLKNFKQTKTN